MHEPDPGPAAPLRVLVVDADDRVRESLTGLLGIGNRVVVVGSAGQPGPALELAESAAPDVVIVDPRLPEVDGGLAFISGLRTRAPDVRVLVMSWTEGLEHSALAERADGFVRKTFRPSELVAAILAAARPSA
jgi:DNA-binding NarL/FixJ family response regulator